MTASRSLDSEALSPLRILAIAALATRWRRRASSDIPFRMPLWPLPPLVAIVGVIVGLDQQTGRDFLITGLIVAAAAAYHGWRWWNRRGVATPVPGGLR